MGIIDDFLKGLPINPVLRERIGILGKKVDEMNASINRLTKKNEALEKENASFLAEVTELKQQLSKQKASTSNFTPIRGLKIKNLPAGGYEETIAYCFHCESPLSSAHRTKTLSCSKCGYKSSIQARHLSLVIAELKKEELPEWWKRKY